MQRKDFFATLAGTFLFGWAAAFVGSAQEVEWLYWLGIVFVGLPLIILMLWLGR